MRTARIGSCLGLLLVALLATPVQAQGPTIEAPPIEVPPVDAPELSDDDPNEIVAIWSGASAGICILNDQICIGCDTGFTTEEQETSVNDGRVVLPWGDNQYFVVCVG